MGTRRWLRLSVALLVVVAGTQVTLARAPA